MKAHWILSLLAGTAATLVTGQTVFNDSWSDGGLDNGADPQDTAWYTTTSSSAIEVGTGFMGLVSGTSGRGIHTLFTPQALATGDVLKATFTFMTPDTVGSGRSNSIRVGIFNSLGRALDSNQSLSSSSPNPLFDGLPGYMMHWDLNTGSENIGFLEHDVNATLGRFMSTTDEFIDIDTGGGPYSFAANTTYTGVLTLTRTGADSLQLDGLLLSGGNELASFSTVHGSAVNASFDMLAFQVNSNVFGSTSSSNTPDNGIDFSNIMVEYTAVPEPSTVAAFLGLVTLFMALRRRRS